MHGDSIEEDYTAANAADGRALMLVLIASLSLLSYCNAGVASKSASVAAVRAVKQGRL